MYLCVRFLVLVGVCVKYYVSLWCVHVICVFDACVFVDMSMSVSFIYIHFSVYVHVSVSVKGYEGMVVCVVCVTECMAVFLSKCDSMDVGIYVYV